jgi:oligoendopeptidase F
MRLSFLVERFNCYIGCHEKSEPINNIFFKGAFAMRILKSGLLLTLLVLIISQSSFAVPSTLNRDEIDDSFKWNLSDIYSNWDEWAVDKAEMETLIADFAKYKGTIANGDADNFLTILQASTKLNRMFSKVYNYPALMAVEDSRIQDIQGKFQEANLLNNNLTQARSWLNPEILSVEKSILDGWVESTEGLKVYSFRIEELFRQEAHTLSADKEELLSFGGGFNLTPSTSYEMFSSADAKFKTITLSDGTEIVATYGNYQMVQRTNLNQEDRMAAMKAYYSLYDDYENTYASIASGIFQRNWFNAKAHNYDTTLESVLDNDAIPVDVYMTLIETAKEGNAPLQRYHELRKEAFGLEKYYYFDAYLPLVEADAMFSWDEAKENVAKGVKTLGKEYQSELVKAYDGRWIDVYENFGKQQGAFSQGMYDVHPYIKMNYNDTMNDMFTLAHELGHAMHSVYSSSTQEYPVAAYPTFIAEVASTMNEALLMDYLLEEIKDPSLRIALLQQSIDGIAGTFYRQVMFADYELQAHSLAEDGKPITASILQDLYVNTQKAYFGESLDGHDLYRNTWAYVSHFFFEEPYYVFQYATSKSATTKLHEDLTKGKKKDKKAALKRYIELISAGGIDQPVTLLQNAGVDMTQKATYQAIVDRMDELVTLLETELVKVGKIQR